MLFFSFFGKGFLIHADRQRSRALLCAEHQKVGNFRKCRVLFKPDAVGILPFRILHRDDQYVNLEI